MNKAKNMSIIDMIQLKRIERLISRQKLYLKNYPESDCHYVVLQLFASPRWIRENVKNKLEGKGYSITQNNKHFLVSWD